MGRFGGPEKQSDRERAVSRTLQPTWQASERGPPRPRFRSVFGRYGHDTRVHVSCEHDMCEHTHPACMLSCLVG